VSTRRQEIQRLLAASEVSFEDLRRLLRVPVAVLEEDLRHVDRSLRSAGRRLRVEPARCPECGFALRQRPGRFATAGRCPRCGNERLLAPRLTIPEE
jgi:transcriptional regulator